MCSTLDQNPVGERGSKRKGGEIHEDNDQVAAPGGNYGDSRCGVCSIAKDDMHPHRQRSEDLLLPTAEEREVVMQAGEEGSRQVLLQRDVTAGVAKGGERNGREE